MANKKAKMKKRFVVGYWGDWQVIYGRDQFRINGSDYHKTGPDFCHRMTVGQARSALKQMQSGGASVFELVLVK